MYSESQELVVCPPPQELAPSDPVGSFVWISEQSYIELKWKGNYWASQYQRVNKKLKESEAALADAKAEIKDLQHRLYGKKGEKNSGKKDTIGSRPSSRPRGQQKGSRGHGRTQRPTLPIVEETLDLEPSDKQCSQCGQDYQPLGKTEESTIIEVHVKAHVRRIKRPMYVRGCDCENTSGVITASPAPRLIPKSPIGISVWVEVLINKFLFSRATYNLCSEYQLRGLPISPGTITGGLQKLAPLFEPLLACWKKKQLTETLFHNDETGWKVFESIDGKVGYRWYLWVTRSPSVIIYTMAPSRSGDIPIDYFLGLEKSLDQVIVACDRYSAYKRLARENTLILLAFCWAHVRRDFLDAARRWPEMNAWMLGWVETIGQLYHLNAQRLLCWNDSQSLLDQSHDFSQRHQALEQAIEQMSAECDAELSKDTLHNVQRQVLSSLKNHWEGLIVFVKYPHVPMDNNAAEQSMRTPVTGRKNCYGSGRQWSAELAAMLYSLLQTIKLWKLNAHHWLYSYLTACAKNGGQPPVDLSLFTPWQMSEERQQWLQQPLPTPSVAEATTDTPPSRAQSP